MKMKLVLVSLLAGLSFQARVSHRNRVPSYHGSSFSVPHSSHGSSSSIPFVSHGQSYSASRPHISQGSSYSASQPPISQGSSYSASQPPISQESSYSASQPPISQGSSYSASQPPISHGSSYSASQPPISHGSSYSAPISSYSIPHVSSYSAPPSIPVVSYSQYISVSGSGPGVVCKNVTERRCSPKLKLERVPDQRLVMKDVLLDEPDQINGENKVFEPVEEDMVFNTTQAIPFPVNRTVKNVFYQEVSKATTISVDVVNSRQEPSTTFSVRDPGFTWVCPPGDEGIKYQTSFIQLLPSPLQDGTRNVLNLTIPAGLKDCTRQPQTKIVDVTIPGNTLFEIIQEARTVNVKELMRKEDPFTIFEILYKPVSVPKRELVRKFKLQKKIVKVDFTRQMKKTVGETSSIKKIEYVEDTKCEEITVEKCLPVPGLNPSHSGLHRGYTRRL